jgi:hypothetical protein
MGISKWFLPIMSIIILVVIIIGFVYIQSEISGLKPISPILPASSTATPMTNGYPKLICSDTNLSIVYEHGYHLLAVNATITNIGNGSANGISLWIQTYFPNGTEAINYNMTLWEPRVVVNSHLIYPTGVNLFSGQSYLVQSGNDNELYVLPDNWIENNDFLASYVLTPIFQEG